MTAKKTSDSLSLFPMPDGPDMTFEKQALKAGARFVAGADEAGRGPLAGPVVAAAVILDPKNIPPGLNDSKKLTAAKRDVLFDAILKSAIVSIASSSARTIDAIDIRKASLDAMRRAIGALEETADFALIDGRDVPPGLSCPAKAIIKGDARSLSIAAASIVAKVSRDRMMARAGRIYPAYGFEKHAGYGTAPHRAAIEENGVCPLHRMSFRPCSLYRPDSV
ncbi:ribonuclease HII [Rhizobium sp. L1K21]|uniref:ribonuclease HII n=1 Tax=Rhizobium sp. L1K21 TaxID=2954933 RepID=UPI002092C59F|nr:ribonuclease HII [Rhizobium sp. L1K21]MCO6186930.1 ribonuclease HII [Rhizobium sp. L1K21]